MKKRVHLVTSALVLALLRRAPGRAMQAQHLHEKLRYRRDMEAALRTLVRDGLVEKFTQHKPPGVAGRPPVVYRLARARSDSA